MKRYAILTILLFSCISLFAQQPKYIFYFIGDGMSFNQIELAGGDSISFCSFPYKGTLTTHSSSDEITDSAAAGTALASGKKTSNGTIGMLADHKTKVKSVAYDAQESGRKVAIISSVSLDHATPAAFYASAPSRRSAYEIAAQLPSTGFDLFAGAGFVQPKELFKTLTDSLYTIVRGKDAKLTPGEKTVWIQDEGKVPGNLPYAATDRKADDLTLPIIVQRSIDFLADNPSTGFFMMAEGGQIDWACHANNPINTRGEVIDFSNAVQFAIEFYNSHPDQTLIIVTADHETGGLGLNPISWSTKDHTATKVPVFAIGVGAEKFAGDKDNTAIAELIRQLL